MRHKKALGMVVLVLTLLLAVALVALSPLIIWLLEVILGSGDAATCAFSVMDGRGTAKCKIDELTITREKIELNGKEQKKEKTEESEDAIKENVAELMRACLQKGGGLNSRAFDRSWGFTRGEEVCLECAHIQFEGGPVIDDFETYLIETDVKGLNEKKYIDLLTKDAKHEEDYNQYGIKNDIAPQGLDLSPFNEYTLYFMGMKEKKLEELIYEVALPDNFVEALSDYDDSFFVYITRSNDINEKCKKLVN